MTDLFNPVLPVAGVVVLEVVGVALKLRAIDFTRGMESFSFSMGLI